MVGGGGPQPTKPTHVQAWHVLRLALKIQSSVNMISTSILSVAYLLQRLPAVSNGGATLWGCQTLQAVQDGFCGGLSTIPAWLEITETLHREKSTSSGWVYLVAVSPHLLLDVEAALADALEADVPRRSPLRDPLPGRAVLDAESGPGRSMRRSLRGLGTVGWNLFPCVFSLAISALCIYMDISSLPPGLIAKHLEGCDDVGVGVDLRRLDLAEASQGRDEPPSRPPPRFADRTPSAHAQPSFASPHHA